MCHLSVNEGSARFQVFEPSIHTTDFCRHLRIYALENSHDDAEA